MSSHRRRDPNEPEYRAQSYLTTCPSCKQSVYMRVDRKGTKRAYETWSDARLGDNAVHRCAGLPQGLVRYAKPTPEQQKQIARNEASEIAQGIIATKDGIPDVVEQLQAMGARVQFMREWLEHAPDTERILAIHAFRARLQTEANILAVLEKEGHSLVRRSEKLVQRRSVQAATSNPSAAQPAPPARAYPMHSHPPARGPHVQSQKAPSARAYPMHSLQQPGEQQARALSSAAAPEGWVHDTHYAIVLYSYMKNDGQALVGQETTGSCYQLRTKAGERCRRDISQVGEPTYDEAAYLTLIEALTDLCGRIERGGHDAGEFSLTVYSHNTLLLKDLEGTYAARKGQLQPLRVRAEELLMRFSGVELTWRDGSAIERLLRS